ncbi:MAG: ATP-binding protein [Gemmiger sp.]|uniref:ATP-binding protein n=1 Tax=Gemmiger sp. TaxID=2049027 RepID=UPI002E79A1F0|nr:ATP-binding protein [Gemmiger sp.]MEE0800328.1 ATP-binding protein [Gemmiger sp.]
MNTLPDIPRLYTALAEWLACLLYVLALHRRFGRAVTAVLSTGVLAGLGVFLQLTGGVPLAWWIPCMAAAVAVMYLYLFLCCSVTAFAAGYCCARAFILAEFAASLEWQIHCLLWPQRGGADPRAIVLLAVVYTAVYGFMYWYEFRRLQQMRDLGITQRALVSAVVLALTAFAVSNLAFAQDGQATMNVFYIRTLVDLAGVLVLSIQQEQLLEARLHRELEAMDNVLHRQYEQYQQSRESIRLINRHCHDLKLQIAAIRAEHDPGKRAAALDEMESGIRMYEAQNKTGNPVLDTLLTAKSLYCQQHDINFTCVADGHLLDFMPTGDICTIVGTALDNATESVQTLSDAEKRLIRIAIYAQHGFVMLRFENYCETPVHLDADGMPPHGYGVRTVRAAAEKYGGTVTVHSEDNWFILRVLLPHLPA